MVTLVPASQPCCLAIGPQLSQLREGADTSDVIKAHDQAITHHSRANAVCATVGIIDLRVRSPIGQRPPQSRAAPEESRGGNAVLIGNGGNGGNGTNGGPGGTGGGRGLLFGQNGMNRPGMSGDSISWKGWSHVRWCIEEVPAGVA
jgi:hypothetical protein